MVPAHSLLVVPCDVPLIFKPGLTPEFHATVPVSPAANAPDTKLTVNAKTTTNVATVVVRESFESFEKVGMFHLLLIFNFACAPLGKGAKALLLRLFFANSNTRYSRSIT
jgi:hypothetical protein